MDYVACMIPVKTTEMAGFGLFLSVIKLCGSQLPQSKQSQSGSTEELTNDKWHLSRSHWIRIYIQLVMCETFELVLSLVTFSTFHHGIVCSRSDVSLQTVPLNLTVISFSNILWTSVLFLVATFHSVLWSLSIYMSGLNWARFFLQGICLWLKNKGLICNKINKSNNKDVRAEWAAYLYLFQYKR